jgi:purine catabolism regulator
MVRLQAILSHPQLHLRHVAGPADFERTVTGAHSSEQLDPTPFLNGGELLMLDGLILPRDREAVRDYIQRLSDKGICAVAFGVAPHPPFRPEVPPELVAAADNVGMPLFEIRPDTPFLAVTQAVFTLISEENFATTKQLAAAQQRLAAAAAQPDPLTQIAKTLGELAALGCTVCDVKGEPLTPLPDDAHLAMAARYADKLRSHGLNISATEDAPTERRFLQPLGTAAVRGAVVYSIALGDIDAPLPREIMSFATTLLSIELERRYAVRVLERRPGDQAVRRLLTAMPPARAAQLVESVGIRSERIQAVAVPHVEQGAHLIDDLDNALPNVLLCPYRDNELILLIPAGDAFALDILKTVLNRRPAGVGGSVQPHNFAASLRQARQAAEVSATTGGGLVDAMDLGSLRVMLQLGPADSLRAFSDAVLGPIETGARSEEAATLMASLRCYLQADAIHDRAAAAAGVHRHTLRKHLRRIEELTGRALDATRDRAELWMALQARDLSATRTDD